MIVPALGDIADGIRLRAVERGDAGIIGRRHAGPLGHAEGDEAGAFGAFALEKCGVGRIGAGIAALHVVDAEIVQHAGNGDLVLDREVDAGRLLPVAQCRVEEIDAFACHVRFAGMRRLQIQMIPA